MMASIRLLLLVKQLVVIIVNLALLWFDVVEPKPRQSDSSLQTWLKIYNDIKYNEHPSGEVANRVDQITKLLAQSKEAQSKKNEITLLQQASQVDFQLCNRDHLDKLSELVLSYSDSICLDCQEAKFQPNYLKRYLFAQIEKLLALCRANESDALLTKLKAKDDVDGLKKAIRLAKLVNQKEKGEFLLNELYYNKHMTSAGIIKLLKEKVKDEGLDWKDYSKRLPSWLRIRKKFDRIYNECVLEPCNNWIKATNKLYNWAEYRKHWPEGEMKSLEEIRLPENETRFLNARFLCQSIISKSKELKKRVYKMTDKVSPSD